MKGFYIEISNNLLDPKHCRQMGDAVWLFMWLIDRMTVIDYDEGKGKVLGGKPIKFDEVTGDLGISRSTYIRWMEVLRKGDYVETTRTPHGQCVTVMKAKKRFGRSVKNDTSDVPDMTHQMSENETCNKTVSVDSTVRQDKGAASRAEKLEMKYNPLGSEIIHAFCEFNPACKKHYGNKTQRGACDRLIEAHGFEKVIKVVGILPKTNPMPYVPTITTPYQLEEKWSALEAAMRKKKSEHDSSNEKYKVAF